MSFLRNLGGPEIAILVIVLVVVFGAKRLPDVARSLGESLKIFKHEIKDLSESDPAKPEQRSSGSDDTPQS